MSNFIVPLIVVAVVGSSIFTAVWKAKCKLRQLSQAAFGTDSFIEGYKNQTDILAETPKSVSGMTRLMEPQIMRDFPDFSWEQFKGKAENMLTSAFLAISADNPAKLTSDASDSLKDQIRNIVEANKAAGIKETYSDIQIHQTEIANYRHEAGKCIITIQSAVGYLHYKEQDGRLVGGQKERKTQTKYNTELIYIQDAGIAGYDNAVGTTCPNCGAPITNVGNFRCEYCGSQVTPINIKVWSLHKFYEVDYNHS
jgi:predicted lipid-binding transport protein (Tim44 family)